MAGRKAGTPSRPEEDDAPRGNRPIIQAVVKALAVLSLFDVLRPEWSIDEMMEETGLSRMAVYRIVKTLESVGYLVADSTGGGYHIGPALLAITYINAGWAADIKKAARPHLEDLAAQTGETVTLAIEKDGVAIDMDEVETSRPFRRPWAPGRIIAYGTSHTKVFAAFKSPSKLQKILGPAPYIPTAETGAETQDATSELERIRRDGVAFSLEEAYRGVCAVAAPVHDQFGEVVASIAVVAPPGRFGSKERKLYADAVKATATALSAFLGYLDEEQKFQMNQPAV